MNSNLSSKNEALIFTVLTLTAVILLVTGCATTDVDRVHNGFERHIVWCSKKHGYDPKNLSGVGEYELAPNERKWRDCVYEGIRTLILPATTIPEAYSAFIAEDRKMTDAIDRGEMTRAQRKRKTASLLEEIKRRENVERVKIEDAFLERTRRANEEHRRQEEMQDFLLRQPR